MAADFARGSKKEKTLSQPFGLPAPFAKGAWYFYCHVAVGVPSPLSQKGVAFAKQMTGDFLFLFLYHAGLFTIPRNSGSPAGPVMANTKGRSTMNSTVSSGGAAAPASLEITV